MEARIVKIRLSHVSLISVLAILATSEYTFAVDVLGMPEIVTGGHEWSPLAAAVPIGIDTYVVLALRRGGVDVKWAMALVAVSVTGGTIAHLVELATPVKVLLAGLFAVVMAIVAWRVHEIEREGKTLAQRTADAEDVARRALADAEAARGQVAAHARERDDAAALVAQLRRDLERTAVERHTQPPARPVATQPTRPSAKPSPKATPARGGGDDLPATVRRLAREHPNWTQGQIADEVGCSERTVRRHLNAGPQLHAVGENR